MIGRILHDPARARVLDKLLTAVVKPVEAENQTAEVVRRVAIGLVVCTFFLAIVRYVAGIYQKHYNEMLRAQMDDLAVKRFYVAYKGAGPDPKDKKSVVTAFVSGFPTVPDTESLVLQALSKDEIGLIKTLLSAAAKKI